MLVVALSLTAVSTGVCACELGTADARSDDDPPLLALRMGLVLGSPDGSGARSIGVWPDTDIERKPFETVMTGRYAGMLRQPQLMERIRKVESI